MAQAREEIGFEHKGIGSVLAQNRLTVPLNQREYSWEEEHVKDLFSDFATAIAKGKNSYFLGTIVLTRGEGDIPEVSDGQQRLATTTILLAAIRDYFSSIGDKKRADSIEHDFLKTTDRETTETLPKLRLNVDDNEFFSNFVISSPHETNRKKAQPQRQSHERIKKAHELAAEHVKDILAAYTKQDIKISRLLEYIKFIEHGAEVILLKVPDHLNAFMMFETLNDRGLKASQADLLKNHLLSLSGDRLKEGQQKWAKMLGILESLGRGDITVSYLHHLLITKHGPIKEREVFDKVKEIVNSQSRAIEFLDELSESANDYVALFNAEHQKWNEYGTSTRKHISTINRDIRVEQIRPLMFAVSKHFSIKEGIIAFKLFVFWSVRFLIIGVRGGLLDRNYAVAAEKIGSKQITTAVDLKKELDSIIPNDALFQTAFSEVRISHGFFARYLLRALEMKIKNELEPEFVPQDDEQTINLEHILPESPGNNWPGIDSEIAQAYSKRLGNMVILQATKNVLIGNSDFSTKKSQFKASGYLLTSEVSKYLSWSPKEIGERQKRLAELAVQTWPSKV
jgi:hypothetical protein